VRSICGCRGRRARASPSTATNSCLFPLRVWNIRCGLRVGPGSESRLAPLSLLLPNLLPPDLHPAGAFTPPDQRPAGSFCVLGSVLTWHIGPRQIAPSSRAEGQRPLGRTRGLGSVAWRGSFNQQSCWSCCGSRCRSRYCRCAKDSRREARDAGVPRQTVPSTTNSVVPEANGIRLPELRRLKLARTGYIAPAGGLQHRM
jgi:hypothetical protein